MIPARTLAIALILLPWGSSPVAAQTLQPASAHMFPGDRESVSAVEFRGDAVRVGTTYRLAELPDGKGPPRTGVELWQETAAGERVQRLWLGYRPSFWRHEPQQVWLVTATSGMDSEAGWVVLYDWERGVASPTTLTPADVKESEVFDFSPDGWLLVATSSAIVGLDTTTGATLWSRPRVSEFFTGVAPYDRSRALLHTRDGDSFLVLGRSGVEREVRLPFPATAVGHDPVTRRLAVASPPYNALGFRSVVDISILEDDNLTLVAGGRGPVQGWTRLHFLADGTRLLADHQGSAELFAIDPSLLRSLGQYDTTPQAPFRTTWTSGFFAKGGGEPPNARLEWYAASDGRLAYDAPTESRGMAHFDVAGVRSANIPSLTDPLVLSTREGGLDGVSVPRVADCGSDDDVKASGPVTLPTGQADQVVVWREPRLPVVKPLGPGDHVVAVPQAVELALGEPTFDPGPPGTREILSAVLYEDGSAVRRVVCDAEWVALEGRSISMPGAVSTIAITFAAAILARRRR